MSRALANFQSTFDELADSLGLLPADVAANAALQSNLLNVFNRAYLKGWTKRVWEDAWSGQEVAPTGGTLIDFATLADARRFEVWTADPRPVGSVAIPVRYMTGSDGIQLMTRQTTVYVLSMPLMVKFTTTAWVSAASYAAGDRVLYTDGQCWRCVTANSDATWTVANWTREPLLQVLAEFTVAYARGTSLIQHAGQPDTGSRARQDALDDLERLAQIEHFRTATNLWQPTP